MHIGVAATSPIVTSLVISTKPTLPYHHTYHLPLGEEERGRRSGELVGGEK